MMRFCFLLAVFATFPAWVSAQKTEYKDGLLSIDKQPIARIIGVKNKEALGLVKDFMVVNMAGDTLFTAVYSDLIPEDPNDNLMYYFEFRFKGRPAPAYLPVSKLGGDKTISNHIGNYGLIKNQQLDLAAVQALVQKKGKTPPVRFVYTMVARNRSFPVEIREAKQISQAGVLIGIFADQGTQSSVDVYQFMLPDGKLIAMANFSGGNNAPAVNITTYKDNITHTFSTAGDPITMIAAVDRNYYTLKKIAQWLVSNNYL